MSVRKANQMKFCNAAVELFGKVEVLSRTQLEEAATKAGVGIPPYMCTRSVGDNQFKVSLPTYTEAEIAAELAAIVTEVPVQVTNKDSQIDLNLSKEDSVSFIPERDSTYVPFGDFNDIKKILRSNKFAPIYVSGLSGNGKSTMIEQICAQLKRPMIRINMNNAVHEEDLIGSKTLKDGNVEIVEGPVLFAMRQGCVLLIDEIDAANSNAIMCLQRVLEGKSYYFKMKGEMVHPVEGFTIVATGNTKGKGDDTGRFVGTNVLNDAFLERFSVTIEQEFPPMKIEEEIILKKMAREGYEDKDFAGLLARYVDAIRKTYANGGIDELISTRRVEHIVVQYGIFKNKLKAITMCVSRFDPEVKSAFIELFKKVDSGEEAAGEVAVDPTVEVPF